MDTHIYSNISEVGTSTLIYENSNTDSVSYWNSSGDNVTVLYVDKQKGNSNGFVMKELDKGFEDGMTAYLFFIAVISTSFNFLVLFLYLKYKNLRSPMNLMFVNLAVSDLTVTLFGTWFEFVWTAMYKKQTAGTLACDFYGFVTFLGGMASLGNLTAISLARYLTVVRPFNIGNITYGGAAISILSVWAFALVWGAPPLMGWSDYVPESVGYYCSINWLDESARSYITCIFLLGFIVPVGLLCFSYGSVLLKVKEVAKSQGQGQVSTAAKAEKTITKMSAIMVSGYLFAWTPYAVVCMGATYGSPEVFTPDIAALPALFAKSANCYNPIIYVFMNKQFREAMILLLFRGNNPFERQRKVAPDVSANPIATAGITTVGHPEDMKNVPPAEA